MAGTHKIDPSTFTSLMLLQSEQKADFKTGEIVKNAQGVIKWGVTVFATWEGEYGMPGAKEPISIGIASNTDPASGLSPGTEIQVDNMRVGVMEPTLKDRGKGPYVTGGKPFYSGTAIRSANGKSSYKPTADTSSAA